MAVMPKAQVRHWWNTLKGQEAFSFYLFILPWVIGFLVFTAGPILASFGLSFMHYDIILPPEFTGLENFKNWFWIPCSLKVWAIRFILSPLQYLCK